ncbi:ABC-2 type transport system ATP-binding protein [Sporobacter termitidis DSM 10068]|uniref:ABC-2 type transport system ATP-binding protein n=1 Tax=Sporobacter termitidis DSM 10068 TaxID=1123282 RepID=A0A1M5Y7E5_9FIRM|nr:ABC transporter ATP-binding protein [Sporobacter termitidis]SHI07892.1 ABC-2 type transport system ATP-binding protein [Sporobacter termitidis DSM 10068]
MIETKGLVKSFDGFKALDGIELAVGKGSIYGLVGPNGAGKSTLIRHLAGIYRQDAGEVLVAGRPVYENTDVKSRIAYIPDDIYHFMQASTRDMMRFYRRIYPRFDMARYSALKDIFVSVDERQSIRRLSKGMQKQSAFWIAVCTNPDVILLDEPVDGLDPIMRRQIWSIIMADVAERGTTVLVSSHNLRELEDVCDHMGVMNKGQLMLQRSVSELQDNLTKVQLVFENAAPDFSAWPEALHHAQSGRIHTLILRCSQEEAKGRLKLLSPILLDTVPLTLEEIFIYELGGADYAVKDIIL